MRSARPSSSFAWRIDRLAVIHIALDVLHMETKLSILRVRCTTDRLLAALTLRSSGSLDTPRPTHVLAGVLAETVNVTLSSGCTA